MKNSLRPTSLDVAKLAGLLEGEGSFNFSRYDNDLRPFVEMTSIDLDVVDWVNERFGGWVGKRGRKGWKPHWKDQYRWCASGARAIGIMMSIYPYMHECRAARIKGIIHEWKTSGRKLQQHNIDVVWRNA